MQTPAAPSRNLPSRRDLRPDPLGHLLLPVLSLSFSDRSFFTLLPSVLSSEAESLGRALADNGETRRETLGFLLGTSVLAVVYNACRPRSSNPRLMHASPDDG